MTSVEIFVPLVFVRRFTDSTGYTLLKGIYDSFVEKVNENNYNFSNVLGVGIGVPGPVDF